jgi:hypothetical protein
MALKTAALPMFMRLRRHVTYFSLVYCMQGGDVLVEVDRPGAYNVKLFLHNGAPIHDSGVPRKKIYLQ